MTSGDPRRQILLHLFRAALARVEGRRRTREALLEEPVSVRPRRVWAIAVGKAAAAMALGAHDALGSALERTLVITKQGHVPPETQSLPSVEIHESAHPVPDERSLAAGERLLHWVETLPKDIEPLFLISGGASSLVEVLEPGVTLEDLAQLNAWGLSSGAAIGEINARRAALSRIKGGRLVERLGGRTARALFISDVPGDDPAVIGSGLLGPVSGKPLGGAVDGVQRRIVASIDHATEAVCQEAELFGLEAYRDPNRFADDAERLAVRFTHELHLDKTPVRVWGGESVVHLPERPGRGGRNQHLALTAARLIAGHEDLLLLAAGTDGTDGPTTDAGAIVDGETCARILIAELDVEHCLRTAQSGTALAASGDLIDTGPTGTNVCDIVIGLKLSVAEAKTALETYARASRSVSRQPPQSQCFGGVFIRGYRCIRQLAAGPVSDLYLAENERDGSLVAVKLARDRCEENDLDHTFRRFLQEYEIAQRVRHPSVVRLYDLGIRDDYAYLVMEYFQAGDLRRRMRAGLTPEESLRAAAEVARALEGIHQAGVLHRDLKPGNVMIRSDGSFALIDFGLAKDAALELAVTDHGLIFGTPHYMSPEQGHGEPIDARSDVYSLGIMLFEMLTREKPYVADEAMAIVYKHRHAPIPSLPEPLRALQPLIDTLIAKRPEDRPPSAAAAAMAIEEALRAFTSTQA